jgi:hypothetical protein
VSYTLLRRPTGSGSYVVIATDIGAASGGTASSRSDTPPADGLYDYVVRAVFSSGATSEDSGSVTARSDRTGPALAVTCNGAACGSTFYTAAVAVAVTASDATGVSALDRTVDGTATSGTGTTASFTVSGDSSGHTVQITATDPAGNTATTSLTIKIDATPPTAFSVSGARGAANDGVETVDLSWGASSDAASGLAGYTVRWVAASNLSTCPAVTTANYPSSSAASATSFAITLASRQDVCAYVIATDNAGNARSSSATGPTQSR